MGDIPATPIRTYVAMTLEFRDTSFPPGTHSMRVRLTATDVADPRFTAFKDWFDEIGDRAAVAERELPPSFGPFGM